MQKQATSKINSLCYCGEQFTDYQRENIRKTVCRNNAVKYKDDKGKYYCIFHFPSESKKDDFAWEYNKKIENEDYLFYGTWFPIDVDFSNHSFNKLANFAWATFNFDTSFEKVHFLDDCEFYCSTFKKKVSFRDAIFSKNAASLPTNFYSVTFENVADFGNAVFKNGVNFSESKFLVGYFYDSNADFLKFASQSTFSEAIFEEEVKFEKVSFGDSQQKEQFDSFFFNGARFEKLANFQGAYFLLQTSFSKAIFKKTADFRETQVKTSLNFEEALFEGFAKFSGKDYKHTSWSLGSLNFSAVEVEKPERILFETLQLKPDSFTNTDIRKFDFTDIDWKIKKITFDWSRFKNFIWNNEEARRRKSGYKRLEKVYRRFATYAEENNDYVGASNFRFTAFDIQRINKWYGRLPVTLLWWYKWTSRYGENWLWTAFVLLIIIFALFPYIYTQTNFQTCPKEKPIAMSLTVCDSKDEKVKKNCECRNGGLSFGEAITHSLTTATLQSVDYRKPTTNKGEILILLEKIFAPLQAALLALALRRKFMR